MAFEIAQYAQLKSRENWQSWLDSIIDLAMSYEVWEFCDPDSNAAPSKAPQRPAENAELKALQTYEQWLRIHQTEKQGLRKLSDRISATIAEPFRIFYAGIHDVRSKLQALRQAVEPTSQDQKNQVRELYETIRYSQKTH